MRRKLSRTLMADAVFAIMLVALGWHSLKCLFARIFGLPEPELFGIREADPRDVEDNSPWVYEPADLMADPDYSKSFDDFNALVAQTLASRQLERPYGVDEAPKWSQPEPKVFTIPAMGLDTLPAPTREPLELQDLLQKVDGFIKRNRTTEQ